MGSKMVHTQRKYHAEERCCLDCDAVGQDWGTSGELSFCSLLWDKIHPESDRCEANGMF